MNQHKPWLQKVQSASKRVQFLSFFLASILLLTCFSACETEKQLTDEEWIENRITTFVTAYNDGDMDTVMSYLDAKTRNALQAMLNLLGGLADSAAGFNADCLVTACPLCKYNLNKSGKLPVVYFTELLAEALGVKEGNA